MAQTASESVVGASGKVYIADAGTTAPTSATSTLSADWTELGLITSDGVSFNVSKSYSDVESWQTAYPIRKINTTLAGAVSFALIQFNETTLPLALGGGSVASSGGVYTFTPADAGTVDERAIVVEWADGAKNYRIHVSRAINTEAVDVKLTRTSVATLPLKFEILGSNDASAPFTWITNDESFGA
jgi:hypothetical protein